MQCKSSSTFTPIKFKINYTVICKTFPLVSQASLLSIWSNERHWTDTGLCTGQQLMPQQGMHTACRVEVLQISAAVPKVGLGNVQGPEWASACGCQCCACMGQPAKGVGGGESRLNFIHYPCVSSEDRVPFSNSSTQALFLWMVCPKVRSDTLSKNMWRYSANCDLYWV